MASEGSKPVLLVFGAGKNTGQATISLFSTLFNVAVVSRSRPAGLETDGTLSINADLTDPTVVPAVFDEVQARWGRPPSVVIYTAAARTVHSPTDPLKDVTLEQYQKDHNTNVASPLMALQRAVQGFATLPASQHKTFIHVGNKLKVISIPAVLTFGMCKAAMAHAIYDCTEVYADRGYRFYFMDERFADGKPVMAAVSGEGAAERMLALALEPEQKEWYHTFVKGKGYVDFETVDKRARKAGEMR
jgi:hypothetical protein